MTTHAESDGWNAHPEPNFSVPNLGDPAELIAAVPALLGFVPEYSLILITLGGADGITVKATMRQTLAFVDGPDRTVVHPMLAEVVERFAAVCHRERLRTAIAIIVDDNPAVATAIDSVHAGVFGPTELYGYAATAPHAALVDRLEAALWSAGTDLLGAHITARIDGGQRWVSFLGDPSVGTVPDPWTQPATVARVLGGEAIRRSRAEIESTLDAAPNDVRDMVGVALASSREEAESLSDTESLDVILDLVAARENAGFEPVELAAAGHAILRVPVRDIVFGLALGPCADHAEQLWIALARSLPTGGRAVAALLLGYSAYARGEGPLAGIALDAALTADPDLRMAHLLDSALQAGLPPAEIRALADCAFEAAAELGVDLPR